MDLNFTELYNIYFNFSTHCATLSNVGIIILPTLVSMSNLDKILPLHASYSHALVTKNGINLTLFKFQSLEDYLVWLLLT